MRNFVTPKSHGIPRNLGQFRILYGLYGIKKNIQNSVEAEFRRHPIRATNFLSHTIKTKKTPGEIRTCTAWSYMTNMHRPTCLTSIPPSQIRISLDPLPFRTSRIRSDPFLELPVSGSLLFETDPAPELSWPIWSVYNFSQRPHAQNLSLKVILKNTI